VQRLRFVFETKLEFLGEMSCPLKSGYSKINHMSCSLVQDSRESITSVMITCPLEFGIGSRRGGLPYLGEGAHLLHVPVAWRACARSHTILDPTASNFGSCLRGKRGHDCLEFVVAIGNG